MSQGSLSSSPRASDGSSCPHSEEPAAGACAAHAGAPPRWRLIWCHERCHKSEEDATRYALEAKVAGLGGALVCFKKAKTFESWLARVDLPYVLVTDGREIKPCMQALDGLSPRPLRAFVVQPSEKLAARTMAWLQDLPVCRVPCEVSILSDTDAVCDALAVHPPLRGLGERASPAARHRHLKGRASMPVRDFSWRDRAGGDATRADIAPPLWTSGHLVLPIMVSDAAQLAPLMPVSEACGAENEQLRAEAIIADLLRAAEPAIYEE